MYAALRYIYDLSYDSFLTTDTLQVLAKIYVVADKYLIEGLASKAGEQMQLSLRSIPADLTRFPAKGFLDDFLGALEFIITNTTLQDKTRSLLVSFCVLRIESLKWRPDFKAVLSQCGDLGVAILEHEGLRRAIGGTWFRYGGDHDEAVPECPCCEEKYPDDYICVNLDKRVWICPSCDKMERPVCSDCHELIEWE